MMGMTNNNHLLAPLERMLKVFENFKHLLGIALLIVTLSASAQSNFIGTYWHDGEYF